MKFIKFALICALFFSTQTFAAQSKDGIEGFKAYQKKDYKTALQEVTQANLGVIPTYELISSFGPDHKKEFEIALLLNGKEISRAVGSSKKQAQQLAAKIALEKIKK